MAQYSSTFAPPERILMGPGPSTVPARVLQAMSAPTLGHLDPAYLAIMDETRRLMRQVMATENELTMAISGTGSAGMEACVCNLVEPGDEMLVGVNGVFGGRMRDVAERYGAQVHAIEAPWGKSIDPAEVRRMLQQHPRPRSWGSCTRKPRPVSGSRWMKSPPSCRSISALLLVDCVTSLGGLPVATDEWKADAIYSGTQKCLSCLLDLLR
ncbi:MAG: aminotransferase class V-fold PLP-dependent enzyme [Pirellulaceae bacterium]